MHTAFISVRLAIDKRWLNESRIRADLFLSIKNTHTFTHHVAMQNRGEGRETTLHTYRSDSRGVSKRVFCYSQKRVMRSTVGFSEVALPVEPEGVGLGA